MLSGKKKKKSKGSLHRHNQVKISLTVNKSGSFLIVLYTEYLLSKSAKVMFYI